MLHPSRVRWGSALAGLVVPFLLSVTVHAGDEHDEDNLREDVLACEEALGRLQECCGRGFQLTCRFYYDYDYHSVSCDGDSDSTSTHVNPDLNLGESNCIREQSCAAIVSGGTCERAAQARTGRHSWTSSDAGSAPGPAVCR